MTKARHLSRAPIREAIIDIQFAPALALGAIDNWLSTWLSDQDRIKNIWEGVFAIDLSNDKFGASNNSRTVIGRRIELPESSAVAQFRTSGFTFSRLPKYESWEAISAEALKIWNSFAESTSITSISRVAVRYINGIELPLPLAAPGFEKYLTCAPDIPPGMSQILSGFVNNVQICVDDNTTAAVSQVLEGPTNDGKAVQLLLDIDVFETCNQAAAHRDELANRLARLRDIKNDAFFGFLTEDTLEMYE